jgi:hypothetical protein
VEVQEEHQSTQQFKFRQDMLKAKGGEEEREQKLKEEEENRMDMKSCREVDEQALRKENEEKEKLAANDQPEKRLARRRTGAKIPRKLGNHSEDEDADKK